MPATAAAPNVEVGIRARLDGLERDLASARVRLETFDKSFGASGKQMRELEELSRRTAHALKQFEAESRAAAAANDNFARSAARSLSGVGEFFRTAEGGARTMVDVAGSTLSTANNFKLLGLAAYALSSTFRGVVNTGIAKTMSAVGISSLSTVTRVNSAITAIGIAAVPATIAWVTLNHLITLGTKLLDEYSNAQEKLFAADVVGNLERLSRLQTGTLTAEQAQIATALGARLREAKRQIAEFFSIQFDLSEPALKLQGIWVGIVEGVARGATALNNFSISSVGLASTWTAIAASISNAATSMVSMASSAPSYYATMLRLAPQLISGTLSSAPSGTDPAALDASMRAARDKLSASLGVRATGVEGANIGATFAARWSDAMSGLVKAQTPVVAAATQQANAVRSAWDRALDSVTRNIAMTEADARSVDRGAGAQARLRVEAELTEAALRAKLDPTSQKVRQEIERLGERAAKTADNLARLRLQADLRFEREQIFRDPTEAAVAARVRNISDPDGAIAAQARLNEHLKIGKELATDFATSFARDLRRGVGAVEAMNNALNRFVDRLLDMAINNLVGKAFGAAAGGGGFNILGLLGLGGGAVQAGNVPGITTASAAVGVGHSGGMIGAGGVRRYVHPAYFERAPRLHGGGGINWASGERPFIGLTGERVLNRRETSEYGRPVTVQQRVIVNNYGADVSQRTNEEGDLELTVRGLARDELASGRTNGIARQKYGQAPRLTQR